MQKKEQPFLIFECRQRDHSGQIIDFLDRKVLYDCLGNCNRMDGAAIAAYDSTDSDQDVVLISKAEMLLFYEQKMKIKRNWSETFHEDMDSHICAMQARILQAYADHLREAYGGISTGTNEKNSGATRL